jgi:hypothetical protein
MNNLIFNGSCDPALPLNDKNRALRIGLGEVQKKSNIEVYA